jgi:predicted P-loop ATPase
VVLHIPAGTIIPNLPTDYDQLYAQIKHEVCEEKKTYWLSQEENERLQVLNQDYCAVDDFTAMISTCFRKPKENEQGLQMTSLEILAAVQQRYPEVELTRRNQSLLGINLSSMGIMNRRNKNGKVYEVVQIAA